MMEDELEMARVTTDNRSSNPRALEEWIRDMGFVEDKEALHNALDRIEAIARPFKDAQDSEDEDEDNDEDEEWRKELLERKKQRDEELFDRRVPPLYRELKAEDFSGVANLFGSLYEGRSGIVLGNNGAGKTALAYTLYMEWIRNNDDYSTKIIPSYHMLWDLKRKIYKDDRDPQEIIEGLYGKETKHLFIDECDKIKGTDDDYQLFHAVIDYRYQWRLQTVCLANGTPDLLRMKIGQSAYSRLTGDGARMVILKGGDLRRQNNDQKPD